MQDKQDLCDLQRDRLQIEEKSTFFHEHNHVMLKTPVEAFAEVSALVKRNS